MGGSGVTAYFGLYDIAKPRIGDVVLVSAAVGTVGALVCQLAKLSGCKVIGIAENDKKCTWLMDELGVDGAINYKTEDVAPHSTIRAPWATLSSAISRISPPTLSK